MVACEKIISSCFQDIIEIDIMEWLEWMGINELLHHFKNIWMHREVSFI